MSKYPILFDQWEGIGPAAGLLAAHAHQPAAAWLVLPCDLPSVGPEHVGELASCRDPRAFATVWELETGFIEPLFAIWEPAALQYLFREVSAGRTSPSRALNSLECNKIPGAARFLESANTWF